MEIVNEDMHVSRKRQHSGSESRSPSKEIIEIVKKQRLETDDTEVIQETRSDEGQNEKVSETDVSKDLLLAENEEKNTSNTNETIEINDDPAEVKEDSQNNKSSDLENTPSKPKRIKQNTPSKQLTPKQLQKKQEAEKRQKEKEERLKKKLEEKEKLQQEKLKKKELKEKEIELKRKEREEKEEKKRKEREEREQKRKEKEEKEEQKRREREQEKQKKLEEIEEKNKEKLKEEEKKKKTAAAFANFFVAKKQDEVSSSSEEKKVTVSNFLQFEVKSDMKLPPSRRNPLNTEEKDTLDKILLKQDTEASYLKDLRSGKKIGKCSKTWPYEEIIDDDDVVLVDLGETICEDKLSLQKYRAKFLHFHENSRPAYYGTWRKKSKFVSGRRPFGEDKAVLNYEEDSDDDWEEEEQGESLNGSDDEAEKDNDGENDYEVDNEFFVPHGHLSDDEVDDEEVARLTPESLKQKLKLLKEEFDHDMQSKTHKLKPRSIGCIWYNKDGSNVDEAIDSYLQPLAIITTHTQIIIKNRSDIPNLVKDGKNKVSKELDSEILHLFLKAIHNNAKNKNLVVDEFLSDMEKAGNKVNVSKTFLIKQMKQSANWKKYRDEKNKYAFKWTVLPELIEKYNLEN